MNSMRSFLLFAWLMVAVILWMEWNKEQQPAPPAAQTTTQQATATPEGLPPPVAPAAAGATPATTPTAAPGMSATVPAVRTVTLANDVLRLVLDGGHVRRADLLHYRTARADDAPLVRLLDDAPSQRYLAQSGWSSAQGAPDAGGFVPEGATDLALADGANEVSAHFTWTGADGVTIRRTYTLARGSYALQVSDAVNNAGTRPWTGNVYRQLSRIPPKIDHGLTSPERFGFNGAAWYTPEEKYSKRTYEKFDDDGKLDPIAVANAKGGWVALLQHYFFTAWIPQADQPANYELAHVGDLYGISAAGPQFTVPAGGSASSAARLWIGPKLPDQLATLSPGLERAMDYGIFRHIAEPIHRLLGLLHNATGNWGWAIVLLVLIIKLLLYPLSAAQYKSTAKMRKFQPRMAQLKERYADEPQKYQQAMMELYRKEKINPAGGCLPVLIQMPIFLSLYWVLIESVELRQAPWMLWIQDLTSRDPYFILPVINAAVMFVTQRMTPMVGVDPIQQRMFQLMPLIFGVMFAFFPAGLVLYWVTNGALGLLQQWWMLRKYGDKSGGTGSAVVAKG